jgi:hypothetical protein
MTIDANAVKRRDWIPTPALTPRLGCCRAATITVDVTDVNGNTATGVVLMYAEDCTCAF